MKVTKVRLQQIIMTAGCVVFLVWVGIRGQRENGKTTSAPEAQAQTIQKPTQWHVQPVKEQVITVEQVFDVRIVNYPQIAVRSTYAGEVQSVKATVDTWVVAGTPLVELKLNENNGVISVESENILKYAEQMLKEKQEQLQRFTTQDDEGAEEKLKQYKQEYNQAKADLELAMRYVKTEAKNGTQMIVAPKSGKIQEILVSQGDKVN